MTVHFFEDREAAPAGHQYSRSSESVVSRRQLRARGYNRLTSVVKFAVHRGPWTRHLGPLIFQLTARRGHNLSSVSVPLVVVTFFSIWLASTLIIDVRIRRDQTPHLAERLRRHQLSVADEAHEWLHQRR